MAYSIGNYFGLTCKSRNSKQTLKRLNPTITFPPLWLPQIPLHPKRTDYMLEEWNYAMVSINIYNELMDDPESQFPMTDDNPSEDGESTEEMVFKV